MIRRATRQDFSSIIRIWLTCFQGDEAKYVRFFLNSCFPMDRCLLYEENGEAVAMVHLLPQTVRCAGGVYKAQYLYAAATLPLFRGRGIMKRLLEAARQEGAGQGRLFTLLLPASESLYGYYARSGYQKAMVCGSASVTREELLRLFSGGKTRQEGVFTFEEIAARRGAEWPNAVIWDGRMQEYAAKEWMFTGGRIHRFGKGFIFCRRKGDTLAVKEVICAQRDLPDTMQSIMHRYPCTRMDFRLYPAENFPGAAVSRVGMIKPNLPAYADKVQKFSQEQVYFNMMLD